MSIVGIVSEYNPLHTGHAHQIQTLKEQGHVVVALMSGNYVQRGTPAVYDKFVRTRMALAAGVSMVIELPTLYSTASAENFAYGAMVLAQKSGIIDAISFGMEDPSYLPFLQRFAILTEPETALFRKALRRYLDIGLSYPFARESAFFELIGELPPSEPNHILALEYLRAARRIGYSPAWLPLQREGADYRDEKIDPLTVSYPSATALRKLLSQGEDIKKHLADCDRAVVLCATLGAEADRLIRVSQISDMPRAVVIDALASAMTEQVCAQVDRLLAEQLEGCYFTYRFSPGYGDYPIELQREFLRFLDAPRKIGLTVTESFLLTPAKSVTAVAGISAEPVPRGRRGCAVCSLRDTCAYRRKGSHCGFQNLT